MARRCLYCGENLKFPYWQSTSGIAVCSNRCLRKEIGWSEAWRAKHGGQTLYFGYWSRDHMPSDKMFRGPLFPNRDTATQPIEDSVQKFDWSTVIYASSYTSPLVADNSTLSESDFSMYGDDYGDDYDASFEEPLSNEVRMELSTPVSIDQFNVESEIEFEIEGNPAPYSVESATTSAPSENEATTFNAICDWVQTANHPNDVLDLYYNHPLALEYLEEQNQQEDSTCSYNPPDDETWWHSDEEPESNHWTQDEPPIEDETASVYWEEEEVYTY